MEIFMNVGVSEGVISGANVCTAVGELDVTPGGEDIAVGRTWTEKLQAASSSVLNMKLMISRNNLDSSMAFSLCAVASGLLRTVDGAIINPLPDWPLRDSPLFLTTDLFEMLLPYFFIEI